MSLSESIVVGSRRDPCEGTFAIMLKNKTIRPLVLDR